MAGGRAAALSLYRSILRAHAVHLPPRMRELGDAVVKSEFRLHRSVTDQGKLGQFFGGWEEYLDNIRRTARARDAVLTGALDGTTGGRRIGEGEGLKFGSHLPKDVALSEEQAQRLEQLKMEAVKAGSADSEK